MEVGNKVCSMLEFNSGEPRKLFIGVFITKPTNKVKQFARTSTVYLRVQDFRDFVFEFTLNFNRWRRRLYAMRNFVRNRRLKHGNMKDGVNTPESVRKAEGIRVGSCFSKDFEGS